MERFNDLSPEKRSKRMEQNRATELKVGAMVAVGVILFIITVLTLGSDTPFFKKTYILKVQYENVQGLGPGSVVQVLGIPVGNVKEIDLVSHDGTNKLEAQLIIDKAFQSNIVDGSVAGVRTQGALGDKYIYITPGNPGAPPIPNDGYISPEVRGDIFDTIASSGDKVDKLFKAIEEAHKLLASMNEDGRTARLLENMVGAADEMKKAVRDLRGGPADDTKLRQSLAHLSSVLAKIDNGIKRMLGGSSKEKYIKSLVRETIQSGDSVK
jgi:phospholipid/cholesterol/gamma-HCH transport system substrate-binding protein